MRKILAFFLRLSVLLSSVLVLRSVEAPAQDTTSARIPQVELVPVHQREVMDHYINKIMISTGWRLEVFDGARELVLSFDWQELVTVSPNQRYFTVAKPVAGPQGGTMAYDVELRSLSNSILAKGRLSSLGSDGEETHDDFVPSDDGLGIVHKANLALSGGLRFVFFQRQGSRLLRQFEVDKTAFWNANVIYEPAQQMIVASFEGHMAGTKISQTHVQCYSTKGMLQWETTLDSQHVKSYLLVSSFDGSIAFVSRNVLDRSHKNLFLFEKNGKLIRKLSVYHGGLYQRSYFHTVNGRQYFVSPSDGAFYYVIDTESGEIVNRNIQEKEGANVSGVAIFQQKIVTSYFIGRDYRQSPDNIGEFASIKESGLGIENEQGSIIYVPTNLVGLPFLFTSKSGLFVREKLGIDINKNCKFYKINFK